MQKPLESFYEKYYASFAFSSVTVTPISIETLEMSTYLFQGLVHPERAQISLQCSFEFTHFTTSEQATARISIVLNQVAVWVDTNIVWDIHDLRNVVKAMVSHELEVVGFIKGLAYDVEIRRVLNPEHEVDYVFGVEIPCIADRNKGIDLSARASEIRSKTNGDEGVFLHRCFADLVSAMKNADDTGFYCYRAVESLRQHCIVKFDLDPAKKDEQWAKVRKLSGCTEEVLREIKTAADAARHGEVVKITSEQRQRLFLITWDVVDGYLASV